jgi:hypothetical protein
VVPEGSKRETIVRSIGEPPRLQACGGVVSAVGVEAFVKYAGEIGFFSTSRQKDPRLIRNRGSYCSYQWLQPGCVPCGVLLSEPSNVTTSPTSYENLLGNCFAKAMVNVSEMT